MSRRKRLHLGLGNKSCLLVASNHWLTTLNKIKEIYNENDLCRRNIAVTEHNIVCHATNEIEFHLITWRGFSQQVTDYFLVFFFCDIVSDFTETLAQIYEKHAEELQAHVSNYRKKNGELRKEVTWSDWLF